MGRLGRLVLAGSLAAAAVVAAVWDPSAPAAEAVAAPSAAAPAGPLDFPVYPGAEVVRLAGEIAANGRPVQTSFFVTPDAPEEVVRFHVAHFRGKRVDLLDSSIPDGKLLSVTDNHGGRQLLVTARRTGDGRTEVIRGVSPLGVGFGDTEPPPELPLPGDVVFATKTEDRAGGGKAITLTGFAARPAPAFEADLENGFRAAGWEGGRLSGAPPAPGELASSSFRFSRGGSDVTAAVIAGSEQGCTLTLRLVEAGP